MPKVKIDGVGTVQLDDSFNTKAPAEQQSIIDDIASQHAAQAAPQAPRWDVFGDIGRSASGAFDAMKADFSSAFPSGQERLSNMQANQQKYGLVGGMGADLLDGGKRVLSTAKVPLDALGIVASPVTGLIHGLAGSALSYAIPTTDKDTVIPGLFGNTVLYSDPKKAADQILDSSLIGLGPRGIGSGAAVGSVAEDAAAANAARSAVILKNRAISKISERAAADGLTPVGVADSQQAALAGGDQVTLMDLGDKNVRGLAGAVYRAPGPAGKAMGDFLTNRDAASANALTSDVQANIANGSTYSATQDLLKARSEAARPAFQAAQDIGPVHSDRLQQFLNTPEVQKGLRRGLKLERQDSISENRPFKDSEYGVTGYKDGNLDEPIFAPVPTMKSMMVANEGLSTEVADMINPVTGRPTKDGLALKKFRDAFQGELDNLSGGKYKAARDTWSGPAQSMEAVRDGRQHFSRPESNIELQADFNALSPADKDFYRLGAAEAKVDAVERAPDASDKSKRIINSERDRKRFRMLFESDQQAQSFIDAVARKRSAFETKNAVTGNSATAQRFIEDGDNAHAPYFDAARGVAHGLSGNLLGAAKAFLDTKRTLGLRNNPALNMEIHKLLTDPRLSIPNGSENILTPLPVPRKQYTAPLPALGLFGSSALRQRQNQ